MKNRFRKYLLHLFIQYIPSSSKLAKTESKILAKYIFENFSHSDKLLILSEMRANLIELSEESIKEKTHQLQQQEIELQTLIKTLNKLKEINY